MFSVPPSYSIPDRPVTTEEQLQDAVGIGYRSNQSTPGHMTIQSKFIDSGIKCFFTCFLFIYGSTVKKKGEIALLTFIGKYRSLSLGISKREYIVYCVTEL